MDYSRRSADQIGRLVLHVFERLHPGASYSREQSDCICSSLQQINFWQDVAVDWRKGRVYVPQEDLARFGVGEDAIASQRADDRWRDLMAFECGRSRALLRRGDPLAKALPGRLGLEIRATIAGGAAILDRIDAARGDVFRKRPVLSKLDWIRILAKSLA
jgi:phytoene synthase